MGQRAEMLSDNSVSGAWVRDRKRCQTTAFLVPTRASETLLDSSISHSETSLSDVISAPDLGNAVAVENAVRIIDHRGSSIICESRTTLTSPLPPTQTKMRITELFTPDSPVYITAPMINQSDLAFRVLTRRYGATLTYTQMLHPDKLMYNRDYLEYHILNMDPPGTSGLTGTDAGNGGLSLGKPVVAQVCGNDVQKIVEACKKIVGHCDAIGPSFAPEACDMSRIRVMDKLVRFELRVSSHVRSG